jgi:hypothetical protein
VGDRSLARSRRFDGGDRRWSSVWGSCSGGRDPLKWVGTTIWTVLLDALGENLELWGFDVEEPLEVRTCLAFHLIYLLEIVEVLSNDTPRLVRIGVVVADNLRGDYEGRDEETVAA